MDRHEMLRQLQEHGDRRWDILVIGGGATGLGVALDAASRGYNTILLEQEDFAKGTSSRSTKLVHGGVRYLQEGDIGLVKEALHERGLLIRNAPHLVHRENFIIPHYTRWEGIWYTLGLMVYDLLSGKASFGPSRHISKAEVVRRLPGIRTERLKGGILYLDGQFNDARLAVNLAQTAAEKGALVFNHFRVDRLLKNAKGKITGAMATDQETGKTYELLSKSVVNATGVFVDEILRMDTPDAPAQIRPSQGVHLVLDQSFLGQTDAVMIPKTEDGRVLFGVPWEGKLLVGTTDTPLNEHSLEPRALEQEVSFILRTAGQYLQKPPQASDVLSVFAGLRPLAAPKAGDKSTTKEISRSHKIIRSPSGMVTITGGKWTTYRKMAEDTVDNAIEVAGLEPRACVTYDLPIHGSALSNASSVGQQGAARTPSEEHRVSTAGQQGAFLTASKGRKIRLRDMPAGDPFVKDPLALYGSDKSSVAALKTERPEWAQPLHPRLPFTAAEVIWAVRQECALTVEDVLARRVRALFLDARAAIEMAPRVAAVMAEELGKDQQWQEQQKVAFERLARGYLLQ